MTILLILLLSTQLHAQVKDFDNEISLNEVCSNSQKPPERYFVMRRMGPAQTPSHKHYMLCAEPEFKKTGDYYENFRILAFYFTRCSRENIGFNEIDKTHCVDGAVKSKSGRLYKFREPPPTMDNPHSRLFVDEYANIGDRPRVFTYIIYGGPKDFREVHKKCAVKNSDRKFLKALAKSTDEKEMTLYKELTEKQCL